MSDGLSDYWADRMRKEGASVYDPKYAGHSPHPDWVRPLKWDEMFARVSPRSAPIDAPWAQYRPIVPRYEPAVWDDPGPDIDADAELVMGSPAWREKLMAGSDSAWFARLTWDGRPMTAADLGLGDRPAPPPYFWLGKDAE